MLRALRFRLSLLYLAASLGLVALLGAGTYGLLALYFQRSTDLALQYKMSTEFRLRGLTLPAELVLAEQAWMQQGTQLAPASLGLTPQATSQSASNEQVLEEQVTSQSSGQENLEEQVATQSLGEEDVEAQTTREPPDQEDVEEPTTPPPPDEEGPEGQIAPRSSDEEEQKVQLAHQSSGEEDPEEQDTLRSTGDDDRQEQVTAQSSNEEDPWVPIAPPAADEGHLEVQPTVPSPSEDNPQVKAPPRSSIEGALDVRSTPASGELPSEAELDSDDRYDGRLAPVFVVPQVGGAASFGVPVVNDPAAIAGALRDGSDLRTISLGDGRRVRLLTYRVGGEGVLQVGRLLSDQDRLLAQYLTGLLLMGITASVVLAIASWAMAGRSIKQAQQSWDQQQQFISNASHELRTPLTLLRANADYALRNRSPAEREKSLRDIVDECDYMNRMVEDLLLLSRLDAHRLVLTADPVALPEFLSETVRQVERIATAKGVTLTLGPVQGSVRGDKVRMRQALLVVLDNALRFTPSGGTISLSAQVRGREVVVSVTDNGLGISREHLPHIFERFYQVPGQPGEGHGNGLGLSIARGLVEAHRGRMAVTSRKDVGTTVQIIFPLAGPRTGPSRSVRGT
jgi:signal transduction histidine kinase